jgi:hypothetical protein
MPEVLEKIILKSTPKIERKGTLSRTPPNKVKNSTILPPLKHVIPINSRKKGFLAYFLLN